MTSGEQDAMAEDHMQPAEGGKEQEEGDVIKVDAATIAKRKRMPLPMVVDDNGNTRQLTPKEHRRLRRWALPLLSPSTGLIIACSRLLTLLPSLLHTHLLLT